MRKLVIIGLIISIGVISAVIGTYVHELLIPGTVTIIETPEGEYALGAYEDADCTKPLTYVNWGSLQPGESKPLTFYVKNAGNQTIPSYMVEIISDVHNWGASAYYTEIAPEETKEIYASLKVASDAVPGDYSVEIKITWPVP